MLSVAMRADTSLDKVAPAKRVEFGLDVAPNASLGTSSRCAEAKSARVSLSPGRSAGKSVWLKAGGLKEEEGQKPLPQISTRIEHF